VSNDSLKSADHRRDGHQLLAVVLQITPRVYIDTAGIAGLGVLPWRIPLLEIPILGPILSSINRWSISCLHWWY
jgi:hypothetical protein